MFSKGKKWKKLCALVTATFIIGGVTIPQAAFADNPPAQNGGEKTTQPADSGSGTKTPSTTNTQDSNGPAGQNWGEVSNAIMSTLGGIPIPGSSTAKYKFVPMGAFPGIAACKLSPSNVEVGQNYKATCVFSPGTGGGWPVPPIMTVSGVAQKGTNTTKSMYTSIWKCFPHHCGIYGGAVASVSFVAYEGEGGLGDVDSYGAVDGSTDIKPDGSYGQEIWGSGDKPSDDGCYYGVCDSDSDGGNSESWGSDSDSDSGNSESWGSDSYDIEKGAEEAYKESGDNSWGASDADWADSSGGSGGSSDLGDYFGDGDDESGTNPWDGDEYESGSSFGTLDDMMGDGSTEDASSIGSDTDGDGIVDAWDTDGDGQIDAWDTDGDGVADAWDTNGDGITDAWDTNGDGRPDAWDTDGDGIPDAWDTDGDGIPDAWDTDGDGVPDKFAGDGEYTDFDNENNFDNGMFGSLYDNLFGGLGNSNSLLGNISGFLGGLSDSLLGREAKTASDAEMYNIAHGLLNKLGYSDEDIRNGKNYDDGSAYTDPKKAWDMNRITTLMSKHRLKIGTDGNIEKPNASDMKKKANKQKLSNTQGGVISKAADNAAKKSGTMDENKKMAAMGNPPQTEKTQEQMDDEMRQLQDLAKKSGMPEDEQGRREWLKSMVESLPADQKEQVIGAMAEEDKEALGIQ